MTTAKEDKVQALEYIKELPLHDGTLPINDKVENYVVIKGAHGTVYEQEDPLAGMIKAYAISSRLRTIAEKDGTDGFDTESALAEIAKIVASKDGARKAGETNLEKKISDLALGDAPAALIKRISNRSESDTTPAAIVSDIKAVLPELKHASFDEVFDSDVKKAAIEKHYQITETNLFNQSSVRLGYVPDESNPRPDGTLPMRPTHQEGQEAAERHSDDAQQKQTGIATFIRNLGKMAGNYEAQVFTGDTASTIHVFDIGHGDGRTAAAALKEIQALHPDAPIHYIGMDVLETAQIQHKVEAAFKEAGLKNVTTEFVTGTFGLKENDMHFQQNDAKLEPYLGKQDLVIASHVYNFDAASFLKQIEKLQKEKTGIAYIAHESPDSWIGEIRKEHTNILRSGSNKVTEINDVIKGQKRQVDYATFAVPTTDSVPPITPEEMTIFKGMKPGEYQKSHTGGMTEAQRAEFIAKRDVIESYLRAPMEAFSEENRAKLLDSFQDRFVKAMNKEKPLVRNSETQVLLSRNRGRGLIIAVQKAAAATNQELAAAAPWQAVAGREDKPIT